MKPGAAADGRRVVLVDPADFTPPYDTALVEGLIATGWEPILFGMGPGPAPPWYRGHFYAPLRHPLAGRLPKPAARALKGLCHGVDLARLARVIDRCGADVVHWQWMPLPLLDRAALPLFRRSAPVVLTLHDSNPYNGDGSAPMRSGYASLLRGVDAVIVHTRQAAERVRAQGVEPRRIHRIPHGLLNVPAPRAPRRRSGNARLVLLQFGKIKPYKGVDVLLRALAALSEAARERLDVRVVGQPYVPTAPLERYVAEHGLAGTVSFRFGFVPEGELDRVLDEADALLLPYREIDASGVAMTAIGRGLPVLASAVAGFVETFDGCSGACLVPPGDAVALTAVLARWAADPGEIEAMRAGMAAFRNSVPSWAEIAGRTTEVYAAARAAWARGAALPAPA